MGTYETGRENAFRFVHHITDLARRGRVIVVRADDRHAPWPWMKNPAWQNLVLDQLEHQSCVEHARFCEADEIDGLLFTAISNAGDSSIARLQLSDTLDGPIEDTWMRRHVLRPVSAVVPLAGWGWRVALGLAVVAVCVALASGGSEAHPVVPLEVQR